MKTTENDCNNSRVSPKKVMLVFGTRPEAIKMAPLVKAFKVYPDTFTTVVAVTGQHRSMLDQVLELFEIKPEYDLDIMKEGQNLSDITSRVLTGIYEVIGKEKPDLVLVHGDTTTSMAAALAAFYNHTPVGHVEAGLRTGNIYAPWPEEMNRRLTGQLASFHFAPTPAALSNLLAENVKTENITVTGNTVIDALKEVSDKIKDNENIRNDLNHLLTELGYNPMDVIEGKRRMVLITGHRRENFGEGFINICNAIKRLSKKYPDVDFVYPMHLNPNVRRPIAEVFGSKEVPNVFFIEPLDYLPFVYMMNLARVILTDSGGIQEEAPSLGKPVMVMRDVTERPEAVAAGTVFLVGTNQDKIIESVSLFLDDDNIYDLHSNRHNPYGDGHACERIIKFLKYRL